MVTQLQIFQRHISRNKRCEEGQILLLTSCMLHLETTPKSGKSYLYLSVLVISGCMYLVISEKQANTRHAHMYTQTH